MIENLEILLVLQTAWAFAGLFVGILASINVSKRLSKVSAITKMMWYVQLPLTAFSGLWVLWIIGEFLGVGHPIASPILLILLILGSLLALPGAFCMLEEARNNQAPFAKCKA